MMFSKKNKVEGYAKGTKEESSIPLGAGWFSLALSLARYPLSPRG